MHGCLYVCASVYRCICMEVYMYVRVCIGVSARRGVAPVGDVGVLTPTLFAMRGFNTHTFSAVFPQFRTNALQQ